MANWGTLPLELCLTIQSFLQAVDQQELRVVNKNFFNSVEATLPERAGRVASIKFGSRWFQEHFKCFWCFMQIPVQHDLCKRFQCCETCFDSVVKTCAHCKRFPVSISEMHLCEQCEQLWCDDCMYQKCRLYDKFDDDCYTSSRVCFECMLTTHLLTVCDADACDLLLCACVSCKLKRFHNDDCFNQFCSQECANTCGCCMQNSE